MTSTNGFRNNWPSIGEKKKRPQTKCNTLYQLRMDPRQNVKHKIIKFRRGIYLPYDPGTPRY